MKAIQFNAVVGPDQVIRPPEGVHIPEGKIEVVVKPCGSEANSQPARPGPGLCKGMITYMAPDFDAPLDDMKEYME